MKTLPGIKKVEFTQISELILYPKKIIAAGDTISAIGNWHDLEIVGLASCKTTNEHSDNGIVYTTIVNGTLIDHDRFTPLEALPVFFHVYRITDIQNNKYLIGTYKMPAPEIKFNYVNDADPAGQRKIEFEITWISTLPPTLLMLL